VLPHATEAAVRTGAGGRSRFRHLAHHRGVLSSTNTVGPVHLTVSRLARFRPATRLAVSSRINHQVNRATSAILLRRRVEQARSSGPYSAALAGSAPPAFHQPTNGAGLSPRGFVKRQTAKNRPAAARRNAHWFFLVGCDERAPAPPCLALYPREGEPLLFPI